MFDCQDDITIKTQQPYTLRLKQGLKAVFGFLLSFSPNHQKKSIIFQSYLILCQILVLQICTKIHISTNLISQVRRMLIKSFLFLKPKSPLSKSILIIRMSQRKAWTAAQDKALKEIYEKRGVTKWAEISRILHKQFKIQNRSGKQCRERYHNHLDSSIKREKWSAEEQARLIQLQEQLGNRWAEISRSIPGRSENCVKNQFYSILRRGLRKINNIIRSRLKRYKQLEINILYKIVQHSEATDNASNNQGGTHSLKREIAYYGINDLGNQSFDLKKVKEVIEQIKTFCKVGAKKKPAAIKLQEAEKSSEEIQSSQYRDDYPVENKEIKELKPRRDSLYTFHLEKDEEKNHSQETQFKSLCPSPGLMPQSSLLLRKTSLSNISFEGISPRFEATSPKFYDIFASENHLQHHQNSFKSPSTGLICQSPYFDQLRPNFSNWHNLYPH